MTEIYFNSRPREGANVHWPPAQRRERISIPAPVRGRTDLVLLTGDHILISIPAPVRGRTAKAGIPLRVL